MVVPVEAIMMQSSSLLKKNQSNVLSLVMYCDYTVLIFKHATMSPPPGTLDSSRAQRRLVSPPGLSLGLRLLHSVLHLRSRERLERHCTSGGFIQGLTEELKEELEGRDTTPDLETLISLSISLDGKSLDKVTYLTLSLILVISGNHRFSRRLLQF